MLGTQSFTNSASSLRWCVRSASASLSLISLRDGNRLQSSRRSFYSSTTTGGASPPPQTSSPPTTGPSPYVAGDFTHFGYSQVSVNEKEEKVRQVFDKVADSYDLMNDLMSGGLHRLWKDYLLDVSNVASMAEMTRSSYIGDSPRSELCILDVAGGTGDVAFRFIDDAQSLERAKSTGIDPVSVTVCDINHEMLRVGEARARQRYGNALLDDSQGLRFIHGDAQALEFPDNTFDLYTIAFGLRNVTDVDLALQEAHRVLKPGGRFICLEFSHVTIPVMDRLYEMYSFQVIPAMGQIVANDRDSYQYLVESIRKFSNQTELMERMERSGFEEVKYTNLTGGIVALHEGWKPLESST